jgi:hypothetical protein
MNASQSPEYTIPRSAYRYTLEKWKHSTGKLTFSKRLSAYVSSACLSAIVMLLMNPTPELSDPMTKPASLDT